MGTLHYRFGIATRTGEQNINELYIWRKDAVENNDDTLTYYAARQPPEAITYETDTDFSIGGQYIKTRTFPSTPIVEFRHKYSDGAEICIARAILALEERGLNV